MCKNLISPAVKMNFLQQQENRFPQNTCMLEKNFWMGLSVSQTLNHREW